jgi:hypothetical protein
MNKLIIAGAISLLSTAAFAHDKALGDSPEYDSSALVDHSQGTTSQTLPRNHDHGDETAKNFVDHDHERMMAEDPVGHAAWMGTMQHDHGDNTVKNFNDHDHERMMAEDPTGHKAWMDKKNAARSR